MITLPLMQDFHGPEVKPPHQVWVLGPSGPNSVHALHLEHPHLPDTTKVPY